MVLPRVRFIQKLCLAAAAFMVIFYDELSVEKLGDLRQGQTKRQRLFDNVPTVNSELCRSSSLSTTSNSNGSQYYLVASSHDIFNKPVPTQQAVSFLFQRVSPSPSSSTSMLQEDNVGDGDDDGPCSNARLLRAKSLLENLDNTELQSGNDGKVPLSQSAFSQVYIDHRYFANDIDGSGNQSNRVVTQTRRVEIAVFEVAPGYFFFQTHFEGQSGLAVLSLRVEFEGRLPETIIPMNEFGQGDCNTFDYMHVVDQTRFRYEMVTRFGVWGQNSGSNNSSLPTTTFNEAQAAAEGDYASGSGEWVFSTMSDNAANDASFLANFSNSTSAPGLMLMNMTILKEIANAPKSPKSGQGHYRLFRCSLEKYAAGYARGLARFKFKNMCYLGDSNGEVSFWTSSRYC